MRTLLDIDWPARKACLSLIGEIPRIRFTVTTKDGFAASGENMAIVLTDSQKVFCQINPVSAAGNPAPVEGIPEWAVSDGALLAVEPSVDGMSAYVVTVGPVGMSQITVTADADLGEGVRHITGILDVEVIAGEAASLAITAGTPEPK